MKFKIGFTTEKEEKVEPVTCITPPPKPEAVISLVQVKFASKNIPLTYYNDKFDLKKGDLVYVDGKLEGQRGTVVEVEYNFKIKISEYKRVIAVVDTEVHGQFFMASSHFVTFSPITLPKEQIATWFKAPDATEEEYVTNFGDDTSFSLSNLQEFQISHEIADRGFDYYCEGRVRYLAIDGTKGYAIVEGTESYEVEFTYDDGQISHIICGCPCGYHCKHEFATLLELREMLEIIEKHYAAEYKATGYFAAIHKGTLLSCAVMGKETGSITI